MAGDARTNDSDGGAFASVGDARGVLAAIVDSSADAIVSKTLDGVIMSWNRGAERMFGWTAAEAIGRHITLIIPQERRAEEDSVLASLRAGRSVEPFETVRMTKTGARLDISLAVSPVRDTRGRIVGASKIARDISERRRLEDERNRSLEEQTRARESAEAANRTKDELLALVSHELRTPLNSLLGYARMLQDRPLDEPTRARALQVIVRNGTMLTHLVDDLLDLSRIVTGRMRLTFEPCDFATLVHEAVDTVRPAAEAKRIALVVSAPAGMPSISCAPDRLRQVVWNLAMNAIKFTPASGQIAISATADGGHGRLVVSDDGIGITPEVLPYVFDAFRQEDSSTTRTHGGLGIGLALVKRIVELHGGQVHAASSGKGQGATFTVTIPLATE